mgnify:CR=1 FL=1
MIRVQVRPNEPLEAALRRFKRQCNYAGIFRLAGSYARVGLSQLSPAAIAASPWEVRSITFGSSSPLLLAARCSALA